MAVRGGGAAPRGRGGLIAALGLGSALAASGVFMLARAHFGGTAVPVMAGGFVALILPIVAVILFLPRLTGGGE